MIELVPIACLVVVVVAAHLAMRNRWWRMGSALAWMLIWFAVDAAFYSDLATVGEAKAAYRDGDISLAVYRAVLDDNRSALIARTVAATFFAAIAITIGAVVTRARKRG
jgi:hypothetical protein